VAYPQGMAISEATEPLGSLLSRGLGGLDSNPGLTVRIDRFAFGTVRIDGQTYERDVIIDRGEVRLRKKQPSKRFRDEFGHTPLSVYERIPWKCRHLIIGTGMDGALPVMPAVLEKARWRGVDVTAVPTAKAIKLLGHVEPDTNAVLHITC